MKHQTDAKRLLLMRHAKSSWKDGSLPDHDRPLNDRGQRDAPRMGRLLAESGMTPERIVTSSAQRARRTAELVAEASDYGGAIDGRTELYEGGPESYFAVIQSQPDAAQSVLVVGHNPDLEVILAELTGSTVPMPTAALAWLEVPVAAWPEFDPDDGARLVGVWRPKELTGESRIADDVAG